jgi:hypothetical protein
MKTALLRILSLAIQTLGASLFALGVAVLLFIFPHEWSALEFNAVIMSFSGLWLLGCIVWVVGDSFMPYAPKPYAPTPLPHFFPSPVTRK